MANLAKYLKLRQYMADMMLRHTSEDIPLMSERDMCKSFNVTRTTVRKALKIFISEGSIITKRGSGMYLKGLHPQKYLPSSSSAKQDSLYSRRRTKCFL